MSDFLALQDHRSLERIRKVLGDLFVAADYPGGPRTMYRDLLRTENHADRLSERARVAMAVLSGEADDVVEAYYRLRNERDEILCDHCHDLSARFLRAGREAALAELSVERGRMGRLLKRCRDGLRFRGADPGPWTCDAEALIDHLGSFFGFGDAPRRERESA